MKLIKRYANRRLYDADTSKTITLEDVADMIKAGYEIKVIDNVSGSDITAKVLGQTFLKISTDHYNLDFSTYLLSALIREVSGNVSQLFSQLVEGGIGLKNLTKEKLEGIVQSMIEHGDLKMTDKDNYLDTLILQLRSDSAPLKKKVAEGLGLIKSGLEDNRDKKVEELSGKLDEMARLVSELQVGKDSH